MYKFLAGTLLVATNLIVLNPNLIEPFKMDQNPSKMDWNSSKMDWNSSIMDQNPLKCQNQLKIDPFNQIGPKRLLFSMDFIVFYGFWPLSIFKLAF